ncbi:MAG: L,D-transpeptidase family protein [Chloroflexi bacterium]|nr:L,D-transpeptidase family protein [Chloroflexota bacterium]OJV89311.1 MAG: hypothetical protein BGO39_35575 [Chloroflexi bacterium 54-19]
MNINRQKFFVSMVGLIIFFIAFESTGLSTALAATPPAVNDLAAVRVPQPAPKSIVGPAEVFFPNFGQSIANPLLRFWRMNGRYDRFGGPMAKPFTDAQGHTVQYFQKVALAYFPEFAGTSYETRTYPIGRMLYDQQTADVKASKAFQPVAPSPNTQVVKFFPETGHTVQQGFLNLYNSTGDLFMWGYPLTEEYTLVDNLGKTWQTQLFEMGRMLWSPDTGAIIDPNFGTEMAALNNVDVSVNLNANNLPAYSTNLWEHWVDVNLSGQYETFYEGDVPVLTSLVTTGTPNHATPTGTFHILRLVANERMRGGSVGAGDYYDLDNVLYTMYFTWEGHALHYAWWRSVFGVTGSHGCVNEDYNTAYFAWNFLTLGSRVQIHY